MLFMTNLVLLINDYKDMTRKMFIPDEGLDIFFIQLFEEIHGGLVKNLLLYLGILRSN